jgi:hypothetical protein
VSATIGGDLNQAPGHTPGNTVLLIRTTARYVLLERRHVAISPRAGRAARARFNFNREQTLKSMEPVEKLAADTKAR